ncbi:alpha-hydroxy-acid oxidizing protein [Desulfobaculum xiamenense]|nr:alpha-hydroxy-acid oxidizing protein [Desulfobaculum xiamenense]
MKDVRARAREAMKGYCRVCPVCDGRACSGEVPGMGGLGTGSAFRANVTALAGVKLNMRLMHGAAQPDTATSALGLDFDIPVLAAPIGGVSFNMGGALSEDAYVDAILGGCRASGIVGCTGDGVPPFIIDAALGGIRKVDGHGIVFIKPWDGEELEQKLEAAFDTGARVFGMDVDAAGLITLRKMGRPVSPKTPEQLREIIAMVHAAGGKFILKGVMTVDEAELAITVGADAIVVSNHGGRVLDHTPGTAEVLPDIAEAVHGRICIIVDGGVRDGVDVLKMLALGADLVMIGRPFAVAAIGGGQEGVAAYVAALKAQLTQAMVLTGCANVAEADRRILYGFKR